MEVREYIASKKYTNKYSSQIGRYWIPAIDDSSSIEKKLFGNYDSSYDELKESIKEDFEKKVDAVHAKYESQFFDVLLKVINDLDVDISKLNEKLSNTISSISKVK